MIFFNLGAGIVEPIKAGIRDSKLGVGKQEQDDFFTAEENVQRRKLEVELEENEESAKKREVCYCFTLYIFHVKFMHKLCGNII